MKPIAEPGIPVSGNSLRIIGQLAEAEFLRAVEHRGLAVESHTHKSISYDFVVCGLRVQVKSRRLLRDGTIDLCLTRRAGASRKAYLIGEFDVLAVSCSRKWYLIPALVLESGNGETLINKISPAKYAEYIDNWGVFVGQGAARHPMQLRLEFSCPG